MVSGYDVIRDRFPQALWQSPSPAGKKLFPGRSTSIPHRPVRIVNSTSFIRVTSTKVIHLAVQIATVDPTSPRPYVRSQIVRDFISPASNPALPLLISTTDIRAQKTTQIIPNPHVEVAWWIDGTQEQFRITGQAGIIPAPSNDLYRHFLYMTKHAPKGSALEGLATEGFDWEKKRREVFEKLSPKMRAAWCRPPPGSRLQDYEDSKTWPERLEEPKADDEEEEKQRWAMALENFALVVVDPTEVDYLELGIYPNRRTRFWRTLKEGSWDSELVVP